MKLLMISGDRSLAAGRQGAFWQTLVQLSQHWERIDILCPRVAVAEGAWAMLPSNVYVHVSPTSLLGQSGWIRRRGERLHRMHRYDVATVHEYPPFFNGIGALRLRRRTGIPMVFEVHHIVGYPVAASVQEFVGRLLSRLWLPWALRRANAVRTVAASVTETLRSWGVPADRMTIVPSVYLDLQEVAALPLQQAKRYDVACCARLVANKGIPTLLQAIALHPHATLVIIGDGPLRRALETQTRTLGIDGRVTFAGWQTTHAEVLRAIGSAKILVMNSSSEGGPRVVPEALACGVPVIVTDVGSMSDVVTEGVNGIFTSGTPQDLHAKITRLLEDDTLRTAMAQHAPASVARFERAEAVRAYAQFVQSVATTTHRPSASPPVA